jgi:hypothetical protein
VYVLDKGRYKPLSGYEESEWPNYPVYEEVSAHVALSGLISRREAVPEQLFRDVEAEEKAWEARAREQWLVDESNAEMAGIRAEPEAVRPDHDPTRTPGVDPNSTVKTKKLSLKEAEPRVERVLQRNAQATCREIGDEIGCSASLVVKTNSWKACKSAGPRTPSKPKERPLTRSMLAVTPNGENSPEGLVDRLDEMETRYREAYFELKGPEGRASYNGATREVRLQLLVEFAVEQNPAVHEQ